MSKALLKDHLLIEFMNDPDLNHDLVIADVTDIFEIWRKKSGRNYGTDQVALAFSTWWLKQFELHLHRDGKRIGYRQFIEKLAEAH